jgi:hypothetical protein
MRSEIAHGQADVEHEIVQVLSHGRTMTTQEITRSVKARLTPSAADLRKANKRDNESKIDQIIANALQQRRNLCRRSLIERVGHGEFRITEGGHAYLRRHEELLKAAERVFDDMFPDGL